MTDWREGHRGALIMGLRHGMYCVGCCWGLMVVLVAVGVMNIGAMVGLAAVIFLEKLWKRGELLSRLVGVAFLLAVPIGTFVHLVLCGIWATSVVFWWPFFGWSFDGAGLPEIDRGGWSFVLDLCGIAVSWWGIRRFGLTSPSARRRFIRTGQLPRQAVG